MPVWVEAELGAKRACEKMWLCCLYLNMEIERHNRISQSDHTASTHDFMPQNVEAKGRNPGATACVSANVPKMPRNSSELQGGRGRRSPMEPPKTGRVRGPRAEGDRGKPPAGSRRRTRRPWSCRSAGAVIGGRWQRLRATGDC